MDKSFNDRLLKRLADRTKAIDEKLAAAMSNNRRVVKEQSSPSREVKKTEIYTTSVKTTTRIDYFDEQTETEASSGEDMLSNEKENAKPNIQAKHNEMVKRLKKLDKIYKNDDDVNASPPRRRTEENFKVEAEETTESDSGMSKSSNSSSKLAVKLAALADTINQREDDMRHVASKPKQEKPVIANRPWRGGFMPSTQSTIVPQQFPGSIAKTRPQTKKPTAASSSTVQNRATTPKPVVLDQSVLANLEAQGFERCESHSNLAYDYRKGEKDKQMKQTPEKSSKVKEAIEKCNDRDSRTASPVNISPSMSPARGMSPSRLGSPIRMGTPQLIQSTNSPTKFVVKPVLGISGLKSPKAGPSLTVTSALKTSTATSSGSKTSTATSALKTSTATSALKTSTATSALTTSTVASAVGSAPLKSVTTKPDSLIKNSPARSSVRQLSNLYESSSNLSPKKPDPAELPLAQRKALFEKNRGAPVMPKPIGFENKPNQAAKPSASARPCKPVMPTTTLSKNQQTPKCNRSEREEKGLSSVVAMFEQGPGPGVHGGPDHIHKAQQERQREIDMLKQRWDTHKLAQESIVPAPPPLPCDSPLNGSLRQRGVTFSPTYVVEEYDDEFSYDDIDEDDDRSISPVKSPKDYPGLKDTKPIKISPPKPGHLYPNLSDMEVESDAPQSDFDEMIDYYERKQQAEENEKLNSSIESETSGDSLGRIIMGTAKKSLSRSTLNSLKRDLHMSSSSDSMDDSVTQENNNLLNEFLDEALDDDDDDESVTPPKRSRSSFEKDVSSLASHSFEYQQTSSRGQFSNPSGNSETPLQHTISFYRRNQTLSNKTPISPRRQFVNNGYDDDRDVSSDDDNNKQQEAVEKKIQELQQEIIRQEAIISQASQALNLCIATIEFSSSTEQIEAERLLLVATHKRQALVHEVQRLKVEKTLRPLGPDNAKLTEQGDLTLNSITLPLKLDNIRAAARDEKCVHLICLVKCGAQVISTCMQSTNPRNLHDTNRLTFPKSITLEGLYSDFKVAIEVYGLATKSKELLPHEIKYHIAKSKKDANKHGLTPKKSKHQDDKLVRPIFQSMGGPNAVRSPQFSLIGYVVFSLREINRTHFTLNKVPYTSVLEGTIHLKMNCEMTIDIVHRGFLTMFDDICGMGAWHRRWSQLQGDKLSYWKYPEDEKKRIPIDTIDLNACITETVDIVPRDVCARAHTFLLETERPRKPDDQKSLILIPDGKRTIIRHLLSADSKEERIEWCRNLNKALALLRAWGKKKN